MFEGTLLAPQKARTVPDGITVGAWYPKGAKITATELQGTWLHLGTVNGISFQVVAAPPPVVPPAPTVTDDLIVKIQELSDGSRQVTIIHNGVILSDKNIP
jgi:hypothetical protein